MDQILAKFRCVSRKRFASNPDSVEFTTMYDPTLEEDRRFTKATPSGTITMTVDNPAADFEPGADYYVTFRKVE